MYYLSCNGQMAQSFHGKTKHITLSIKKLGVAGCQIFQFLEVCHESLEPCLYIMTKYAHGTHSV